MASTSSQTAFSSASTSTPTLWDVFLSFHGKDARYKFTSHLYASLDRHGIRTYKDDSELISGEVISEALIQAIKESSIYIVVISENYASSSWCLDELVEILSCYRTQQRLVIPVFYNIDPYVVRHQIGSFKEAFEKHQIRFVGESEKVNKWRLALTEVANFSGCHISQNRSEADIIDEIVDEILLIIKPKALDVAKYPVGLDSRVKDITTLLSHDTDGVIRIGIYGMGGVGKTTLAKALYNQLLLGSFKGNCFLANVSEVSGTKGLETLQQQLINDVLKTKKKLEVHNVDEGTKLIGARICSTKVLVVIDDLGHHKQFQALVGPFASGSVVVITTRDEAILDKVEVEPKYRYMLKELNDAQSLELFSRHAFGNATPNNTLMLLSKDILCHAGGLPLALEVFGSNLFDESEEGWRWFIDKLKRVPIDNVGKKLMISFDALKLSDPMLQDIFLDIACFFIGTKKEVFVKILETSYTFINHNIDILKKRCLLTFNGIGELGMHDLLQDMGREIVRNNSPNEPGKHSRLWISEDIHDVLKKHKGTEAIEAIMPDNFHHPDTYEGDSFETKTFKKMSKLRFLYLKDVNLTGSFEQTFEDLRLLCWNNCPWKCLPSDFYPQKLVILELPWSKMRTMWELTMVSQVFKNLKTLNMSYSLDLITTPDFNKLPCLETLILEGCESLKEVCVSIGSLARLVSLNLRFCVSLRSLQDTICNLRALEVLSISGCRSLKSIPIELGNIKSLKVFNADGLTISELPNSKIVEMKLIYGSTPTTSPVNMFDLRGLVPCLVQEQITENVWSTKSEKIEYLNELNEHGSTILKLPDSVGRLSNLVELGLRENRRLETLPDTICNLRSLEVLDIDSCSSLKALPINLGNIKSLKVLNAHGLSVSRLPDSIGHLSNLVELRLGYNKELKTLPDTICNLSSLESLSVAGCDNLEKLPDQLWKLTSLRELEAKGAALLKMLPDIVSGPYALSLQRLYLSESALTALPSGINELSNLQKLDLADCPHLLSIAELPPNLKYLHTNGCLSVESLPNLTNLKQLEVLDLTDCSALTEISGWEELASITSLSLTGCNTSLLACIFTKRFFQIYGRFGHEIEITIPSGFFTDWISQSLDWISQLQDWTVNHSNVEATLSLLSPLNASHNLLAMIVCFKNEKDDGRFSTTYSVKNATSDFIWTRSFSSINDETRMIMVPGSIFSVTDGDDRIELITDAEVCGIHLVYETENTMIDEYSSTIFDVEDERSYPFKRLKLSESGKD